MLWWNKSHDTSSANLNAFRMGDAASRFAAALLAAGVASPLIARVLPRILFEPHPVSGPCVEEWCNRLVRDDAEVCAQAMFENSEAVAIERVPA